MPYTRSFRSTAKPGKDPGVPFVYVALPVMDEPGFLERTLGCLSAQSHPFRLYACVNQPESWWNDPAKIGACENNAASIRLLTERHAFDVEVIDCSSRGRGWTGKRHGVGYARKTVMDRINAVAKPGDIIVSLDADTVFPAGYLGTVASNLAGSREAAALAVPYFHKTPRDEKAARAILRYEIYMRHYFLNLHRIASPYAFTALGSAMALPVWAYRAIGGMTPKLSGEDFYFLQKLRKFGEVLLWNEEIVNPEARFSDRVFFGTGPAMIKGAAGDWSSYPIYPVRHFDEILETYSLLPQLFFHPQQTKVTRFMSEVFKETDPLEPLRLNHRDAGHFARGFHEKFDGLRILQYLKAARETDPAGDEENLRQYLETFHSKEEVDKAGILCKSISFTDSPVEELEKIRMFLFRKEMEVRFTSAPRSPGRRPLSA